MSSRERFITEYCPHCGLSLISDKLTKNCPNCGYQVTITNKDLKNMMPPEGKALVYIIRPQIQGSLVVFKNYINERYIGATKGRKFLYEILEPGMYTITSKAEKYNSLELEAEPNKIYFIKQNLKMGIWMMRVQLELINEVKGRKLLKKCKLFTKY